MKYLGYFPALSTSEVSCFKRNVAILLERFLLRRCTLSWDRIDTFVCFRLRREWHYQGRLRKHGLKVASRWEGSSCGFFSSTLSNTKSLYASKDSFLCYSVVCYRSFVWHLYIFSPIDAKIVSCLFRVSSRDTGKTMVDASLGEIMTTCEKITWLLSEGERWLKPEHRY